METRSLITAHLDWWYCPEEDHLSFGWDLFHSDAADPVAIGAAPGRHLGDLLEQAVATSERLARLTLELVPGQQLSLPTRR